MGGTPRTGPPAIHRGLTDNHLHLHSHQEIVWIFNEPNMHLFEKYIIKEYKTTFGMKGEAHLTELNIYIHIHTS